MRYFVQRVLIAIPTLFAIIAISFFMIRVAPGGPFDANPKVTPEIIANLNRAYHLNEPVYQQFGRYLWRALHFDLGPSFTYRDYSVSQLILKSFPVSADIGLLALFAAVVVGLSIGIYAALQQGSAADHGIMSLGMIGIAIPTFVTGPFFQLLFAVALHWLPVAGWDNGWRCRVLPVMTLSLPPIATISRLTRVSMIESLQAPYIRTARAKGLGTRLIVFRHALPGALLPTLAYLGPAAAGIITGSVVVERVFSIPGVGRYFVEAAANRDYTLVMGTVIFYGALIIVSNLVVDLVYSLVDPRIRQHG